MTALAEPRGDAPALLSTRDKATLYPPVQVTLPEANAIVQIRKIPPAKLLALAGAAIPADMMVQESEKPEQSMNALDALQRDADYSAELVCYAVTTVKFVNKPSIECADDEWSAQDDLSSADFKALSLAIKEDNGLLLPSEKKRMEQEGEDNAATFQKPDEADVESENQNGSGKTG